MASNMVKLQNNEINTININQNNDETPVKNITLNWLSAPSSFTGREDTFDTIQKQLATSNLVVVHGMPGVGKTETARSFGIRHFEHYDGNLLWVFAETLDIIKKCFNDIANTLNLKVTDVFQIYNKFKTSKSLFVFDNVEDMETIREYLPSKEIHPTVHVLITSRFSEWSSSLSNVHLNPLDEEDALEIFRKKLGRDKYEQYSLENWQKLVENLDRIPLCLQIVSSVIKQKICRIRVTEFKLEEFISDLSENFINFTILKCEDYYYNKNVFSAISSALSRLEEEEAFHSLDLLSFIAYINADLIYEFDLLTIPSIKNSAAILEEALNKLVDYSLIQVVEDPTILKLRDRGMKIKTHRTIQLVLRVYDLKKRNGDMFKTVLRTILCQTTFLYLSSIFKYVKKIEFFDKAIEFYHENSPLIDKYLINLAIFHCNEVLQIILPVLKKKYKKTYKYSTLLDVMLYEAIRNKNNDLKTIKLLMKYKPKVYMDNLIYFATNWRSIDLLDTLLESNIFENNDYQHSLKQRILRYFNSSTNTKNISNDKVKGSFLLCLVEDSHKSKYKQTIDCIEHLTTKWNANILFQDEMANNLLHKACYNRYIFIEMITFLVEKYNSKSIVNCQNELMKTPLIIFLENNYRNLDFFDIFCYFVKDCKADITIQDGMRRNALFYVCQKGTFKMVDLCLKQNNCFQIINIQDKEGNVAFAHLIWNRSLKEHEKIKLFYLFVENGMSIILKNNENKTLFQIAVDYGLMELAKKLQGN